MHNKAAEIMRQHVLIFSPYAVKTERLRCISYMFAFSVIGKSLKTQLLKRAKMAEKAENVLL